MSPCPTTEQIERFLLSDPSEWPDMDTHVHECPRCLQALEDLTRDSRILRPEGSESIPDAPGPLPLRALGRVAQENLRHHLRNTPTQVDPSQVLPNRLLAGPSAIPHGTSYLTTGPSESPSDEDVLDALAQLAPSQLPGSLGRLGHYEILGVLGRGAFGVVFRTFDDVLQRVVAVKTLAVRLAATSPARKRFIREARAAAQVQHPNVVYVHAVEEHPIPFLVMELVPGEALQQHLDNAGPFEAPEVVAIAQQLADGLAAAHAVGLIHRDIKPGNVLLEPGSPPRVKITDFGVARAIDDASLTQSGVVVGTPLYMSPEQARGESLDHRSDLFSLGSVLYAITAGHPPFRANGALAILKRVAQDTPRPLREIIPETPDWLCQLISRLMAKDPAHRFQSAAEVRAALDTGTNSPAPTPPSPPRRRLHRTAGVAAAALVPTLAIAWALNSAFQQPGERGKLPGRQLPASTSAGKIPAPASPSTTIDPDRRAAEWVISKEGFVVTLGGSRKLRTPADLPQQPFIVKTVDLGGAPLTDDELAHIEPLKYVEILSLAMTTVTDAGFSHLRGIINLKVLHLGGMRISGVGFSHFTPPQHRIEEIWAESSPITDEGLEPLAALSSLIKLNLGGSKVTDAGMTHLERCPVLAELWLHETALTDAGLAHLQKITSLSFLDVRRTAVTLAGLQRFHVARPDCRIFHDGGTIESRS